uniref:Uncharacterized protein n=1 Tax=Ditylenchus dipsaci TaxID=166011 RepID=A0A915CTV2_9BILA
MCQSINSSHQSSLKQKFVAVKHSKSSKAAHTVDLWTQVELNMISGAAAVIECSLLLVSTITALFSILNPKVKGVFYYVLVLLPISMLLPAPMIRFNNVGGVRCS